MPNDAKLGLVFGVAIVLVVAVVFFRKDQGAALATDAPASVNAPASSTASRGVYRSVRSKQTSQSENEVSEEGRD